MRLSDLEPDDHIFKAIDAIGKAFQELELSRPQGLLALHIMLALMADFEAGEARDRSNDN